MLNYISLKSFLGMDTGTIGSSLRNKPRKKYVVKLFNCATKRWKTKRRISKRRISKRRITKRQKLQKVELQNGELKNVESYKR